MRWTRRSRLSCQSARRAGVIVNVIGYAGERLNARYIIGSTGNAALMAFSRSVGSQAPDFGVRVVAVNPGYTATDLNANRGAQTVTEGTDAIVRMATIGPDGPTGTFVSREGPVPW